MKLIYIIIIFMAFFNIFSFMLGELGIFSYVVHSDEAMWNLSDTTEGTDQELFERVSEQSWSDLLNLDPVALALMGGTIAGTIALAWAMHSPYPLAVGLFLATFINMYGNSRSIFSQLEINPYIRMAMGFGLLILILVTTIEYFTHGDA